MFVEGNINSLKYQEILDESLNSFIAMLRGDGSPIFQQDLAPGHNSRSTKEWLSAHNIYVLHWPVNCTETISSCPLGKLS